MHIIYVGPSCMYPTSMESFLSQTATFIQWLVAMYFAFICRQCNGCMFLAFPQNDSNANKKRQPWLTWIGSPYYCKCKINPHTTIVYISDHIPGFYGTLFISLHTIPKFSSKRFNDLNSHRTEFRPVCILPCLNAWGPSQCSSFGSWWWYSHSTPMQ